MNLVLSSPENKIAETCSTRNKRIFFFCVQINNVLAFPQHIYIVSRMWSKRSQFEWKIDMKKKQENSIHRLHISSQFCKRKEDQQYIKEVSLIVKLI